MRPIARRVLAAVLTLACVGLVDAAEFDEVNALPTPAVAAGPGPATRLEQSVLSPSWQFDDTPGLRGVSGNLSNVSCPAPDTCIAVGGWADLDGFTNPMTEVWDGDVWTMIPAPPSLNAYSADLVDVSCVARDFCVAVGHQGKRHGDVPLGYLWDGTTWTRTRSLATPPGLATFDSVSCPAADLCVAVGYQKDGKRGLAALWNGARWVEIGMENVSGSFQSVSCPRIDSCFAVGRTRGGRTLVGRWDGNHWSAMSSPLSARSSLQDISCVSDNSCLAVGELDWESVLVERWNGTSWSIEDVREPNGRYSDLVSVSCSSATSCTAVGSTSERKRIVISLDRGEWALTTLEQAWATSQGVACPAPNECIAVGRLRKWPQGAAVASSWDGDLWTDLSTKNVQLAYDTDLRDVSCVGGSFCVAAGTYGGGALPLLEMWDGEAWRADLPIRAVREGTGEPDGEQPIMRGVSCTSSASCVAVGGTYHNAVAEIWNGQTWNRRDLRVPKDTREGGSTQLDSVSCITARFCVAVGEHEFVSGDANALLATWNGTSWRRLDSRRFGGFHHIACVSKRRCVIVASGSGGLVTTTWNGEKFRGTTPLSSSPKKISIADLSCVGAKWCAAVGRTKARALILTWNGRIWRTARIPRSLPASATLSGVDCWAVGSCAAVGKTSTKGGSRHVNFALRSTRARWQVDHVPTPTGKRQQLLRVSCGNSSNCVAVGRDSSKPRSGQAFVMSVRG